jgi:hypothetical protein
MESKLPKNWVRVSLDQLFSFSYGKGLRSKDLIDQGYDVYSANGIIGKYSDFISNCGIARVFAYLMEARVKLPMEDEAIFKDTSS